MTAPLPPYKPGSPAWLAGYEHAKRQAAEIADRLSSKWHPGLAAMATGDPDAAAEAYMSFAVWEAAKDILAMRPSPPRYSPGCEPTTLHQRVAAQDSLREALTLYGQPRGNEGVVG